MEILNIRVLKYSKYSERTAGLTIQNKEGEKGIVHVYTIDGLYRKDLGCDFYLLRENSRGWFEDKPNEINKDYFDDYENDIKKIIKEAEDFLSLGLKSSNHII